MNYAIFPQYTICFQLQVKIYKYIQEMLINSPQDMFKNSAFRKFQASPMDMIQINLQEVSVIDSMIQMINAQNILIRRLLQPQCLLYQELNKKVTNLVSNSQNQLRNLNDLKVADCNKQGDLEQASLSSECQFKSNSPSRGPTIIQEVSESCRFKNKQKMTTFENDINSSSFVYDDNNSNLPKKQNQKLKIQTESKNMVKNLAKGIFSYIRKNKQRRIKILTFLKIDEKNFMKSVEHYRDRIHTIYELRLLWTDQGNPFHRAFRILSWEYLRKHCLSRVFNSRIYHYSVHLKYRQRLQEVMENPCQFTILKTN